MTLETDRTIHSMHSQMANNPVLGYYNGLIFKAYLILLRQILDTTKIFHRIVLNFPKLAFGVRTNIISILTRFQEAYR